MTALTLLTALMHHKAGADDELLTVLADEPASAARQAALKVLTHAHIVDRIFAAHLQRQRHWYGSDGAEDLPELSELAEAMRATDAWYLDYLARLGPEALEEEIAFTFTDGAAGRMTRAEMLAHVVTHAGYHRGEVGRLLPGVEAAARRDVFTGYLHRAEPERRRRPA